MNIYSMTMANKNPIGFFVSNGYLWDLNGWRERDIEKRHRKETDKMKRLNNNESNEQEASQVSGRVGAYRANKWG